MASGKRTQPQINVSARPAASL